MKKTIVGKVTAVFLSFAIMLIMLPVWTLEASNAQNYVFDVGEGSVVIGLGTNADTLKVTYGASRAVIDNIPNTQMITLTGKTTENQVVISGSVQANITISDLSIDLNVKSGLSSVDLSGGAALNLTLAGRNILYGGEWCSGIYVPIGCSLTITNESTGSLEAKGGACAAGIGGNGQSRDAGTITINGGTVIAMAPPSMGEPAAIGGGGGGWTGGSVSTVVINGGIVSATGCGKGIGGGAYSTSGTITINGGCVKANGIGTGNYSESQTTTITGGVVFSTASINQSAKSSWNGLIFDNNIGLIYGNSSCTFPNSNFEISNGASLTVTSGQTLTIPAGMTLTNNGTLTIQDGGTLNVNGDAAGSGTLDAQQGSIVNKRVKAAYAPEIASVTIDSVTLKTMAADTIVNYGYRAASAASVDNWQASPVFTGLQVGNSYVFFARFAGDGYYASSVSDGTSLTISAPPAVTVADMSAATWTLTTTDKMEYSTDNGTTWEACAAGMAATAFGWKANLQATQVLFRYASNNNLGNIVQTYTIPGRYAAPDVTIDYASGTANTTAAMEFSTDNGTTWSPCTADMSLLDLGRSTEKETSVKVRIKADSTNHNFASEAQTIQMKVAQQITKQPAADSRSIAVTTTQEEPTYQWYTVSETNVAPTDIENWKSDAVHQWITDGMQNEYKVVIPVEIKADQNSYSFTWGVQGVHDWSFIDETTDMEYSMSNNKTHETIKKSEHDGYRAFQQTINIANLKPGSYTLTITLQSYVVGGDGETGPSVTYGYEDEHYAFLSFPAAAKDVVLPDETGSTLNSTTITSGTKLFCKASYSWGEELKSDVVTMPSVSSISVQAPSFVSETYGTQADAKPIVMSLSGNTDAAITSVAVDNSDFVIAGNGSSIKLGNSINTWTVQPKANLAAGNHKGTITVTYNNGLTSTAEVSIDVNNADLSNVSVLQDGTLTYTGSALSSQIKTTASSVNDQPVTFTYCDIEKGTYTTAVPSFIGAGNHTVYYKATAANHNVYSGSFIVTMTQASQKAPAAPVIESVTSNAITLKTIAQNGAFGTAEYRINGGTWQNSPVFNDLEANTKYTVEARYNGSADFTASEISSTEVTTPGYQIIEGALQKVEINTGNDKPVIFRSNAPLSKLKEVLLDDKLVDRKNYTASSGSTIITFTPEYIATLSEGEHKLSIVSTDGTATTTFTIKKDAAQNDNASEDKAAEDQAADTGDKTNTMFYAVMFMLAMIGLAAGIVYRKRRSE